MLSKKPKSSMFSSWKNGSTGSPTMESSTTLPQIGKSGDASRPSSSSSNHHVSGKSVDSPRGGPPGTPNNSTHNKDKSTMGSLSRGIFSKLRLRDTTITQTVQFESEEMNLKYLDKAEFDTLHVLGTGGFGHVKLVRHKASGKYMAMKIMRKYEIIRLKQVEHVNSERCILAQLQHPFTVRLYSTFVDQANLYMLMEFVPGGELFTYLRSARRFNVNTARYYCACVLCAFEYMHSKDILYRDLKPENLLLDAKGHLKVTDFGFAKKVLDRTWTLCGTPEYLAPEIIQSKGHGKGVDWWALGVLLYEFVAGYPPFYDENPFRIYEKILVGVLEFPEHFDPYAKDLVRKLLVADRTKRYGCLKGGANDIKRHPFFANFDFHGLVTGELKAPIIPDIAHDGDSRNFDEFPEPEDVKPHQLVDDETSKRLFYEFYEFDNV